jgi:hypothetical protein
MFKDLGLDHDGYPMDNQADLETQQHLDRLIDEEITDEMDVPVTKNANLVGEDDDEDLEMILI